MAKKIAEQLIDTLVKSGVERIYAVTGDSLNEVNEAVRKNDQIKWIHVRHEETGAYAAAAGCRIHRNIWDNLSVNFHIDLIYTVFQFLVMIWLDAVVFQQTFFKCSFPCVICGAVLVCRGIGRTFCVSGWDYSSKNAINFSNGMTSI